MPSSARKKKIVVNRSDRSVGYMGTKHIDARAMREIHVMHGFLQVNRTSGISQSILPAAVTEDREHPKLVERGPALYAVAIAARYKFDVIGEPTGAFFFNHTATTDIYTLSLHDALPI